MTAYLKDANDRQFESAVLPCLPKTLRNIFSFHFLEPKLERKENLNWHYRRYMTYMIRYGNPLNLIAKGTEANKLVLANLHRHLERDENDSSTLTKSAITSLKEPITKST